MKTLGRQLSGRSDNSARAQIALILGGVVFVFGWHWLGHDTLLLAAVVWSAGLFFLTRKAKAWLLAGGFVSLGLFWSSLDSQGCSAWCRGRILYEGLSGGLPYMGGSALRRAVLGRCSEVRKPAPGGSVRVRLLDEKVVNGDRWQLFETELGGFWIPAPGEELLKWLVWEMTVQENYEGGDVRVRPGDIVVDAGAHVGVFTAFALRRGAARVIAIEPEPVNIACLEANLQPEIAAGRVTLVKAGLWVKRGSLLLQQSVTDSAKHSFVMALQEGSGAKALPVVTLDETVEQLGLERVDFIKMDIEGAERYALQGARRTITRSRPRMAICTYHLRDDVRAIPAQVRAIQPSYEISAKDVDFNPGRILVKVLFFQQPESRY